MIWYQSRVYICSIPLELSPERYGITAGSGDTVDVTGIFYADTQLMTVSQLLQLLEKHYCDSIAAEFQHLQVNHLHHLLWRPSSLSIVVRQPVSKIFSETAWPIKAKFGGPSMRRGNKSLYIWFRSGVHGNCTAPVQLLYGDRTEIVQWLCNLPVFWGICAPNMYNFSFLINMALKTCKTK